MTLRFGVVCEAPPDARTGCELADRAILENVEWISEEVIDDYRNWNGLGNEDYLLWKKTHTEAKRRNIRTHGHFDGQPGSPDAVATRRALLLFRNETLPVDAIVLLRDEDGQTERLQGLRQARDEIKNQWNIPIVIGFAKVMRECWVLAGFVPQNNSEQERIKELQSELGFDPTLHPEKLTAGDETAKRSSKRVLRLLVQETPEREWECWRKTRLDHLKKRGEKVGLQDYLREIKDELLPLFTGNSRKKT